MTTPQLSYDIFVLFSFLPTCTWLLACVRRLFRYFFSFSLDATLHPHFLRILIKIFDLTEAFASRNQWKENGKAGIDELGTGNSQQMCAFDRCNLIENHFKMTIMATEYVIIKSIILIYLVANETWMLRHAYKHKISDKNEPALFQNERQQIIEIT